MDLRNYFGTASLRASAIMPAAVAAGAVAAAMSNVVRPRLPGRNPIFTFSEQQIQAAQDARIEFSTHGSWALLLAQMQSGKTDAYLLLACLMIRRRIVENVVIFSGNTEIELKDQIVKAVSSVRRKLDRYLRDPEHGIEDEDDRDLFLDEFLERRVKVVWGSQLTKYDGPTTNTLFIWDESHAAQSQRQRPDKFLQSVGISADGNEATLREKGNYVLSVSATSFSELSDNIRFAQGKPVIKMEPGMGYTSVKSIFSSSQLVPYKHRELAILEGFGLAAGTGKKWYAVVRASEKYSAVIETAAASQRWRCVHYDSVHEFEQTARGRRTWENMRNEPEENTVILIRGKCRMGKALEKEHVLFVMETSKSSKTDTILQGLLGRVCGYSNGSDRVKVFLPERIVRSGEIQRYIKLWEQPGVQIMPRKAQNLDKDRVIDYKPYTPIQIHVDRRYFPTNGRRDIIAAVRHALTVDNSLLVNKNSAEVFEEIARNFAREDAKHKVYHLAVENATHNERPLIEIAAAFEVGQARDFGAGFGAEHTDSATRQTNIIVSENIPGFNPDVIYIIGHINKTAAEMRQYAIPTTTGREIFAHTQEDEQTAEGNGGMVIRLSNATAVNEDIMRAELGQMIDTSAQLPGCSRTVASCWDDLDREYKGILVSQEIFDSLKTGGAIFEQALTEQGVRLKITKSRGRVPQDLAARGFVRLASISW